MSGKLRTGLFLSMFMYHVITKVQGSSPPTFNMHYMCNRRSYPDPFTDWKGGFLFFDSKLLPAEHENECAIFLRTTSSQGIVINFSEWEMEGNCDSVNLTIVDGELRDRSYPGKSLNGLRNPVCRSSQNPTNKAYASTESIINIVFKGKTHYWGRYRVKFNITFLSYFKGSCDDDVTMFKCNNGWCIDKRFTCLNLNPCGDESDCSAAEKNTVMKIILNCVWILALAVVCYVIINYFQAQRRFTDIPIIGWFSRKLCNSNPRDQERRPSTSSRHSDICLWQDTIAMERHSLSQSSSVGEHTEDNICHLSIDTAVPPPSYHDLPPTSSLSEIPQPDITQRDIPQPDISQPDKLQPDKPQPEISQPDKLQPDKPQPDMPLPPSYDDAIANSDIYKEEQ